MSGALGPKLRKQIQVISAKSSPSPIMILMSFSHCDEVWFHGASGGLPEVGLCG